MKNIFTRDNTQITPQNQVEGKTLVFVNELEPLDKLFVQMPHSAEFQLFFKLCNGKLLGFFISEQEFNRLLPNDIQQITIHSALNAEKRTVESIKSTYGSFEQQRIGTYLDNLENLVRRNAKDVQKYFGTGK